MAFINGRRLFFAFRGTVPTEVKEVTITENGTVEIVPSDGHVMSKAVANVNVAAPQPVLEAGSATANGAYYPSTGKDGFSSFTVAIPVYNGEVIS